MKVVWVAGCLIVSEVTRGATGRLAPVPLSLCGVVAYLQRKRRVVAL